MTQVQLTTCPCDSCIFLCFVTRDRRSPLYHKRHAMLMSRPPNPATAGFLFWRTLRDLAAASSKIGVLQTQFSDGGRSCARTSYLEGWTAPNSAQNPNLVVCHDNEPCRLWPTSPGTPQCTLVQPSPRASLAYPLLRSDWPNRVRLEPPVDLPAVPPPEREAGSGRRFSIIRSVPGPYLFKTCT